MSTLHHAPALLPFALTFADGSTRTVLASSLQSAVMGVWSASTITKAEASAPINIDLPPPVLTSLNPSSAKVGDPSFTLHVIGSGFTPASVIVFARQDEPTTFVSPTELTTGMNMAVWLGPDALEVTVRALNGVQSNVLIFDMQPAAVEDEVPA